MADDSETLDEVFSKYGHSSKKSKEEKEKPSEFVSQLQERAKYISRMARPTSNKLLHDVVNANNLASSGDPEMDEYMAVIRGTRISSDLSPVVKSKPESTDFQVDFGNDSTTTRTVNSTAQPDPLVNFGVSDSQVPVADDPFSDDTDWMGEILKIEKKWQGHIDPFDPFQYTPTTELKSTSDVASNKPNDSPQPSTNQASNKPSVSPQLSTNQGDNLFDDMDWLREIEKIEQKWQGAPIDEQGKKAERSSEGDVSPQKRARHTDEKEEVITVEMKQKEEDEVVDFSLIKRSNTLDIDMLKSRADLRKKGTLKDRRKPSRPSSLYVPKDYEMNVQLLSDAIFRDSTQPKPLKVDDDDDDDNDEKEKKDEEKTLLDLQEPGKLKKPPPGAIPSPFLLPGLGAGFPPLKKTQPKVPVAKSPTEKAGSEPKVLDEKTKKPVVPERHKGSTKETKTIKKPSVKKQNEKKMFEVEKTNEKTSKEHDKPNQLSPLCSPTGSSNVLLSSIHSPHPAMNTSKKRDPPPKPLKPLKKPPMPEKKKETDVNSTEVDSSIHSLKIVLPPVDSQETIEKKEEKGNEQKEQHSPPKEKAQIEHNSTPEEICNKEKKTLTIEEKRIFKNSSTKEETREIQSPVEVNIIKTMELEKDVLPKKEFNILKIVDTEDEKERENKAETEKYANEKEIDEPKENEVFLADLEDEENISQKIEDDKEDKLIIEKQNKFSEKKTTDDVKKIVKIEHNGEIEKEEKEKENIATTKLRTLDDEEHKEKFTKEEKTKEVLVIEKSVKFPKSLKTETISNEEKGPGKEVTVKKNSEELKSPSWMTETKLISPRASLKPLEKSTTPSIQDNSAGPSWLQEARAKQRANRAKLDEKTDDGKDNSKSVHSDIEVNGFSSTDTKLTRKLPPIIPKPLSPRILSPSEPKIASPSNSEMSSPTESQVMSSREKQVLSPKYTEDNKELSTPKGIPQWKQELAKRRQESLSTGKKTTPVIIPAKKDPSTPMKTTLPQWQLDLAAKKKTNKTSTLDKYLVEDKEDNEPAWKKEAAKRRKQRQSMSSLETSSPVIVDKEADIPVWKKELMQRRRKSDIIIKSSSKDSNPTTPDKPAWMKNLCMTANKDSPSKEFENQLCGKSDDEGETA
uniref:Muscle M-line assembly protein unc-89-like isoform X1 n=1 Tax=Saccoglossus kowalevskii TaxID=10224 RepID=A0ABM0M7T7_SACKO|nr:PREDICTED: muscle M-line assembly protein unc-89-like isoform X1 [Saccoglossus kowalevskii]